MASFAFIGEIVGKEYHNVVTAAVILGGITALCYSTKPEKSSTHLIPEKKLSLQCFMELVAEFIFRLGDNVMGKHNRKYYPFVASLFFYLFISNLSGLIPGVLMPTSGPSFNDGLWFNVGIALVVFVMYHAWGIKEVGLIPYLKHFLGPLIWVAPLMLVIELISHFVRIFSLSLRLYGNMTGDHIVLGVFTDISKFGIPVIFYLLGTFVCFMQAFVFSLLTMIYIRLAVAHEEEAH